MSFSPIITRFAPSPTGYLHVGGARTALFSWLLARHTGGKFLLRIEDTDLARSTQKAVDALLDDLNWLGLNFDNADAVVFQSKRLDIYNTIIDDLIARGLAYKAFETREELDALKAIAEREKRSYIYQRPQLTDEQLRSFESEDRPHVVRFAMPKEPLSFRDVVLDKEISVAADQVQDFVIRKTDGMPTYHFAVVVDDAAMNITHVLRGQEHLLNTINHIALQAALNYSRPTYGHLPVILNTDGSKMGKRDRDKKIRQATHQWLKLQHLPSDLAESGIAESRISEWLKSDTMQLDPSEHAQLMPILGLRESDLPEILVHDFRANGYLPEAMLNFLALLGWNPGNDRERMSTDEMTQLFSLDRIGKGNAKFDREKLKAFQTEAVANAPLDRQRAGLQDFLAANPQSPLINATDDQLDHALIMSAGYRTFRDVQDKCAALFQADDAIEVDVAAVEKVLRKNDGEGGKVLAEIRERLNVVEPWTHESIDAAIKQFCEEKTLGMGKVAQPIRVAITGSTISPSIGLSLEFLGKNSSMNRIDRCVRMLT